MGGMFSGSSQRRAALEQQRIQMEEINRQRAVADGQRANTMQDMLERDTNRLLRTYGSKALMGTGARTVQAA